MWQYFQTLRIQFSRKQGNVLLSVLVFGTIATMIIMSGAASYAIFEHRATRKVYSRDLAFHIAEAGISYYRWHLAHNPTDYYDGTDDPDLSPYVHEYYDKNGTTIGYFSLEIDEPLLGSTVVTIRSTGWTIQEPDSTRTLQIRVGFPALSDKTFLANSNMNFSASSVVQGEVHANGGIRFDGTSDSYVRSAQETYTYSGSTQQGVWGTGGPTSFWEYPVPAIDFESITADLSAIRTAAQEPEGDYYTSSGASGYFIEFLGDETYDLYRVNSRWCYRDFSYNWLCYDMNTTNRTFLGNNPIPDNGFMFFEDDIWVQGTIDRRLVIGAGRFPVLPETYQEIYISGNITYAQAGTTNVLGLIAQGNIFIPYNVPNDMHIDAALLSQFGSISRPGYYSYYSQAVKDQLTIFGSQAFYTQSGMKYVSGNSVVSGFEDTQYIYDGNLLYYPPPGFPVEPTYTLISWEELL